tara:strand:+ start:4392 stop:5117 length:726 start_codon:yes stop_codon:yes gene_type:complete
MATSVIKKETIKRLIEDVKELIINPLHEQNIYYKHDEENFLNGYAMIIGPKNTPYQNGYYFFHFLFPEDYPYSPPKVTYLTNDGITRFHPNFYRSGKCCLSILNTWKGEEWTSCLTISSVLLSLCMVFTRDSLLHEPGIKEGCKEIGYYNDIIEFKNIYHSIYFVLKNTPGHFFSFAKNKIDENIFLNECKSHFKENKKEILSFLEEKAKTPKYEITFPFYNMHEMVIDYSSLYNMFKKLK